MKLQQFTATQALPIPIDQAWDFFTQVQNLLLLTPPELEMTLHHGADRELYAGQIIEYGVKPLPLYRTRWVTHITQVKNGVYFTDEQLYGPYATWHHTHFFHAIDGGTLIEDVIYYRLPFGLIGKLFLPIVKRQLTGIFRFRESVLKQQFGTLNQL